MIKILQERIQQADLTRQQKTIAEYFLGNMERIGSMASIEVAREIGVSDASIIRFTRAIGFEGFADLKRFIYTSLAEGSESSVRNLKLLDRVDVLSEKYQGADLPETFLELMLFNTERSFRQNPMEKYEELSEEILHADNKFIGGFRGCTGAATQFARLLSFVTDGVSPLPQNELEAISKLQDIREGDLLVYFAFARYYQIDQTIIDLTKKRGARICLITDSPLAPIVKQSDIILYAENSNLSFFNSTIGTHLIAEFIITLVASKDGQDYRQKLEERDAMLNRFLLLDK